MLGSEFLNPVDDNFFCRQPRYIELRSRISQLLPEEQSRFSLPSERLVGACFRSEIYSGQQEIKIQMYHSRGIGFTADPSLRIQSSRPIAQDRPRGVRNVETGVIDTRTMSSMITDSIVMIDVECPLLPQGVDRTRLKRRMTDAITVLGEGFQSTPGNQALKRDPFSFKVWSTGTELTEKVMTEMYPPVAEYTSQNQSVSAEPSGPR